MMKYSIILERRCRECLSESFFGFNICIFDIVTLLFFKSLCLGYKAMWYVFCI